MKRLLLFFLILILTSLILPPGIALSLTPAQYAFQVIQRDLPQTIRWFGEVSMASSKTQAEVYSLYQSALPEAQKNRQQGISVKGSIDRMLLLLEGVRYFEQVDRGTLEFQNNKANVMRVLQGAKDHLDRARFGEDPQVLLEEWVGAVAGMENPAKFSDDVVQVFTEIQRLLSDESSASTEMVISDPEAAHEIELNLQQDQSFELQRFSSYLQSVEVGSVTLECQSAVEWKTDRAESCTKDDPIECDRSYARQCKKLQ